MKICSHQPVVPHTVDMKTFLQNVRSSRRGAAPGPSGMTMEHLRPLLQSDRDSQLFYEVGVEVSRGSAPDVFWDAFRMGRVTALTKPDSGVRGIVVGDVFRRLIARTIAQESGETVQSATAPYQYALKTRAGTECVSHILQTLVQSDANATIVSIDDIGVFDFVSRNAMLRGLKEMDTGDRVLPLVRRFYGQPSLHIWEDKVGDVQDVHQGEGGDQGDPLMPLLFSIAMHPSPVSTGDLLREGEKLFAFLDDVYLICKPERVLEVFRLIENALWIHSRIRVHCGKTQLWNRSGTTPGFEPRCSRVARRPSFATGRRRVGISSGA